MAELQVLNGPLQWQTIKVAGPRFLIGRRDGCHLVLKDGWTSREHSVLIERAPGEFIVQDLDSENGIFVNGVRVTEASLKHSDVLRIGRTEMRFFSLPAAAGDDDEARNLTVKDRPSPRPSDPGGRTSVERQTLASADAPTEPADFDVTMHEPGAGRAGRPDLRERVRRLEKLVQQMEEENARLAAENAVFKRAMASAGLINRQTGQMDLLRLRTPPPRDAVDPSFRRMVWNPLSPMAFPDPGGGVIIPPGAEVEADLALGLFRLGVVGAGCGGARLADAFYRAGHRRTVGICGRREAVRDLVLPAARCLSLDLPADTKALGDVRKAVTASRLRFEAVFREGLGTDRTLYLLALGLGEAWGAGALAALLESLEEFDHLVRPAPRPGAMETAARTPVGVLLTLPTREELEAEGGRDLLAECVDTARTLHGSGRIHPFILCDHRRLATFLGGPMDEARPQWSSTVAGAFDALNRLAVLPPVSGSLEGEALRALVLDGGLSTFGIAATRDVADPDAVRRAVHHALGDGLFCASVPPSRALRAAIAVVIGSEVSSGGAAVLARVESAVEDAKGILPQARPLTGIYQDDGASVRVIAWVGGLPFPESLMA